MSLFHNGHKIGKAFHNGHLIGGGGGGTPPVPPTPSVLVAANNGTFKAGFASPELAIYYVVTPGGSLTPQAVAPLGVTCWGLHQDYGGSTYMRLFFPAGSVPTSPKKLTVNGTIMILPLDPGTPDPNFMQFELLGPPPNLILVGNSYDVTVEEA